jgi:hypothetical protein
MDHVAMPLISAYPNGRCDSMDVKSGIDFYCLKEAVLAHT